MYNLKKPLLFFFSLFLFSFCVHAQENVYKKGEIIVNEIKTIEAYIEIDFRFPQQFQSSITYMSTSDYNKYQEGKKLKGRTLKKIKPKDIIGFNLEEGRSFRTVKYLNPSGSNKLAIATKSMCLEKVVEGKIDVYKLYSHTNEKNSIEITSVINKSEKENDAEILIQHIQNNFQLLVQKNNENPKNLMAVSLFNYFGDDAIVKKNYTTNHYGFRDEFTEKQSGVIVDKKLETGFLKLIIDYDSRSKGQVTK